VILFVLGGHSQGYPINIERPAVPDEITIHSMTAQDILDDFTIMLEQYDVYPNKLIGRSEIIPTFDDIQNALHQREALTSSTSSHFMYSYPKHGLGGPDYRHGELATDVDTNRQGILPNADYYIQASTSRQESIRRIRDIQERMSTSFHERLVQRWKQKSPRFPSREYNDDVFEISCPSNPNHVLVVSQYGVTIRDTITGIVVAKGIESIPNGTVTREADGNYRILLQQDGDPSNSRIHGVVSLNSLDTQGFEDLDKDHEVQKFCQKLQSRLNIANSKNWMQGS
jgi:hypothetical protein